MMRTSSWLDCTLDEDNVGEERTEGIDDVVVLWEYKEVEVLEKLVELTEEEELVEWTEEEEEELVEWTVEELVECWTEEETGRKMSDGKLDMSSGLLVFSKYFLR